MTGNDDDNSNRWSIAAQPFLAFIRSILSKTLGLNHEGREEEQAAKGDGGVNH